MEFESLMEMAAIDKKRFLTAGSVPSIDKLLASKFNDALAWIGNTSKAKAQR